jgi:dihydrolipoamide dehydrogenase
MTQKYDVVVLGAGPGGYVAAIRAAQLGKNVAVVEERYWGGVCLNVGCIPSKALLRNAEIASTYRDHAADFGIVGDVSFDFGVAHDRSRRVADGRVKGVHFLMKKNGITEIDGRGVLTGPQAMDVRRPDGTVDQIEFEHAIIATGSRTRMLPGVERSARVVTYEEQILDRDLPGSMLVVGAGAIGMELGYVAQAYGVDVTVVEYLDRALPNEDPEVSKEITRAYKKLGIDVLTSTKVESVTDHGDRVTVVYSRGEVQESVDVDRVLVSVGFAPNVEGIGLEAAGVELDDRGAIAIDERMRTNVPHIHAIGDVTMKLQLAHVAEAQGVVAAETIAGAQTMELGDYRMMPRATFSQPQVASFGLTEAEAVAEGHEVQVVKFPFSANGKAHGLGEPTGFVKLVAGAKHGELLGGHLVGPDVSELLPELTLAQKWDLGAFELARNVHTHPTLSEALQETFHGLAGHMINL